MVDGVPVRQLGDEWPRIPRQRVESDPVKTKQDNLCSDQLGSPYSDRDRSTYINTNPTKKDISRSDSAICSTKAMVVIDIFEMCQFDRSRTLMPYAWPWVYIIGRGSRERVMDCLLEYKVYVEHTKKGHAAHLHCYTITHAWSVCPYVCGIQSVTAAEREVLPSRARPSIPVT
jgi:hypothetical protein